MKPKIKTRRELERDRGNYKEIAFLGWVIAIILIILLTLTLIFPQTYYKYRELQTQLSKCQEDLENTKCEDMIIYGENTMSINWELVWECGLTYEDVQKLRCKVEGRCGVIE